MSAKEKPHCDYHRYERSKSNKKIYRCVEPDCRHYIARDKIEGKRARCYKCAQPFILSWPQLRNHRPVCELCTKSPKKEFVKASIKAAEQVLQDFPDLGSLFTIEKDSHENSTQS